MSGKQWVILIGTAVVAGIGVFLGADVQLEDWADLNKPRLVLGAVLAMASAIVAFFKGDSRR